MPKDLRNHREEESEKLRKHIEALLWKAGYVASKPIGALGKSEGYTVTIRTMSASVYYETDRGDEAKIKMLTKYVDVLCTHGLKASLCNEETMEPHIVI
jgi:hypothetical protein